jgi:hypothetical protein
MAELYVNMGFKENPFSKYSAEEEKEYINEIYEKPRYYATVCSDIESGTSRFLMGERGIGKSALMYKLLDDLRNKNIFPVLIDKYDGVPIKSNEQELINLIIGKVVTDLGIKLLQAPKVIKRLNKIEREKLAFVITYFFESLSKSQIENLYGKTTHSNSKNLLKKLFNWFLLRPLNIVLSGTSEYVGATVSKAVGLNQIPSEQVYKEFLKEFDIKNGIPEGKLAYQEYKDLKEILNEIADIIIKLGYRRVVVFFDQIDEYKVLKSKIDSISDFILPIVTDNSLLYMDSIGFEFVVWNKVKAKLKEKQVRFDKFEPIDIGWNEGEIKKIIDRRIQYFSDNKIKELETIMNKDYVEQILQVVGGSPRNTIKLLHKIYLEQSRIDENVSFFSNEAVKEGLNNFCMTYEYEMLFPESQIKKSIDKIMRVKKQEFEIKDLTDVYKVSSQSGINWVKNMLDYALVEEIDNSGSNKKRYQVIDKKLVYLIENDLKYLG